MAPSHRKVLFTLLAMLGVAVAALHPPRSRADTAPGPVQRLQQQLTRGAQRARLRINGVPLYALPGVERFYRQRHFAPAWSKAGRLSAGASALLAAIHDSAAQGLRASDYHLAMLQRDRIKQRWVDLDLLMTDAYLTLAHDYAYGRVSPAAVDRHWFLARRDRFDLVSYLSFALDHHDIGASLRALLPRAPGYQHLVEALARYRQLHAQGGWPPLPAGRTLAEGDRGPRVRALRHRLRLSGDFTGDAPKDGAQFGAALEQAVERFQRRHGLSVDGVVGRNTRAALNVSAARRIRQIEVNLERWRWLPRDWRQRRIQVNIPDFALKAVADGHVLFRSPVIVGRPSRATPVFGATLIAVVVNPPWRVPRSIAVHEELPRIRADVHYLARNHLEVLQGWGSKAHVINPANIDWQQLGAHDFPYRLRQAPGPHNALGRIKFLLPNPYEIYLHDTPARALFARTRRAFSHGCVRVARAHALAQFLLSRNPGWQASQLHDDLESLRERTIRLATPWPVRIIYRTAWVGAHGLMQFRRDLYHRDPAVARALGLSPAKAAAQRSGA